MNLLLRPTEHQLHECPLGGWCAQRTRGSYKKLLALFHVDERDYLKFMDFLRHQRLKPE